MPALEVTRAARDVSAEIGSAGGALELVGSARVSIPQGALEEPATVRASLRELEEVQRLERDFVPLSEPLVVTPHGLELERSARVELRIDDEEASAGELRVLRLDHEEDTSWSRVADLRVLEPETRPEGDFALREGEGEDSLQGERRVAVEVRSFSIFVAVRVATTDCGGREAGFECRPAAGPCDVAETCDGQSDACPADAFEAADVVCASTAACMLGLCSGSSAECVTGPAPADTPCDDGIFCNGVDTCDGAGLCVSPGDPCSGPDGDADCSETCDEAAAACTANDPDGSACAPAACAEGTCGGGSCLETLACPIFVDLAGADTSTCGSGWGSAACATLAQANQRVVDTSNTRVFVTQGTFAVTGDVPVLAMQAGTEYYGGFVGTENTLAERPDPTAFDTYTQLAGDYSTTSHVVEGASGTVLDGFEVTGGVGFEGGGMYNIGLVDVTVRNSRFFDNANDGGMGSGLGMYSNTVDGLTLENVDFDANGAFNAFFQGQGAGMTNINSTVSLTDVSFDGNTVNATDAGRGGALYDEDTSNSLLRVRFANNVLDSDGGDYPRGGAYAIAGTATINTQLTDVDFENNTVQAAGPSSEGGALAVLNTGAGSLVQLDGVSFRGNENHSSGGGSYGGALSVTNTTVLVDDSIFEQNVADQSYTFGYGGGMYVNGATVTLTRVSFIENVAGPFGSSGGQGIGGGLYLENANADLMQVQLINNTARRDTGTGPGASGAAGGGIGSMASDVTLDRCDFLGNLAIAADSSQDTTTTAGAWYMQDGAVAFRNCSFVANDAGAEPALRLADAGTVASIEQCSFVDHPGIAVRVNSINGMPLYNSTFLGNGTDLEEVDLGTATDADFVCSEGGLGTNATVASGATVHGVLAASGHPFATSAGSCVAAGDTGFADAAVGASLWSTYTVLLDGTLLGGQVATGRLYDPESDLVIRSLDVTATTLSWTTFAPAGTTCAVNGDGLATPYDVPSADTAAGSFAHGQASAQTLTLRCQAGGLVARASADVP